jgi:16S rRNA (cytosine1402-N4)-methyltransferase
VLVEEVLEALSPMAGGFYVDATFGRGGHAARLLQAVGPAGGVLALDRDPAAIAAGRARFADDPRLELVQSDFGRVAEVVVAHAHGRPVQGVLLDLGVSSPQLEDPARGFADGLKLFFGEPRDEGRGQWIGGERGHRRGAAQA